ncbi:Cutinase [Tolypocladium paradoxum]|uniref:cutinase n=1 Tax=Tolypocladium paradoxum TaxID=94208 RepID=A0A2S4KM61_9HYPO|nr:Cutinase [Tolypocladium paradoxum]
MKSFAAAALAALAVASSPSDDMEIQVGITAHDFTDHGCRDVVVLFARGSLEAGNLGSICGPATAQGLRGNFGAERVAVEGIEYMALLETNHFPGGADPDGVSEMKRLIANVTGNCPGSKLLVGGYSQGAAITHRAVESLPRSQKNKITAAFTFGDTQNEQDHGKINNFPAQKTHIICNEDDGNCGGTLVLTPAHMNYTVRVPEQVDFLMKRLAADDCQPLDLVARGPP